jgi:hypothetical protein
MTRTVLCAYWLANLRSLRDLANKRGKERVGSIKSKLRYMREVVMETMQQLLKCLDAPLVSQQRQDEGQGKTSCSNAEGKRYSAVMLTGFMFMCPPIPILVSIGSPHLLLHAQH